MIRIKKGNREMKIPYTAFKNFYEGSGWEIVENESSDEVIEEEDSGYDESEEDDWDNLKNDVEKPLSEMNRLELTEKAEKEGIDISDCANNKQIREKIRNSLK